MQIVAILKRKDASSVIVAVVLAIVAASAVQGWTTRIANWLSGLDSGSGGWRVGFWRPLFGLIVSIIVFEILVRVYTNLSASQATAKKK